jgi:hypothetical protein
MSVEKNINKMQHLEGSGTPVLYIRRTVFKRLTCLESNPIHFKHYVGSAEKRGYNCNPLATQY